MDKIAVAISGGVDSLVTAYILKKYKMPLLGINFVTGFEDKPNESSMKDKLSKISDRLNMPIEIINISDQFKLNIVDYFIKTYGEGQTPNPCLVCNYKIKFGLLVNEAKKYGATKIATGHYAKIGRYTNGALYLERAIDRMKDQSYFLSRLKQTQLAKAIFPIGDMTKSQVISIAARNNLQPISNRESQDICFVKAKKYGDFIDKSIGSPKPGEIIDVNGKYLGMHKGLRYFTVGQRRGLNCPSKKPYYVIKIDKINNRLIVGEKQSLYASKCNVKNINWISARPKGVIRADIRIRYRHSSSTATVTPTENNSAIIRFDVPQLAVSPGQAAVFYTDSKVIGSGWIEAL